MEINPLNSASEFALSQPSRGWDFALYASSDDEDYTPPDRPVPLPPTITDVSSSDSDTESPHSSLRKSTGECTPNSPRSPNQASTTLAQLNDVGTKKDTGALRTMYRRMSKMSLSELPDPAKPKAAIKEGFLSKKGHKRTNWMVRWFRLTDTELTYYTKDTANHRKGMIPLDVSEEVKIEKVTDYDAKSKKRSFCFRLTFIPKEKELLVDAGSAEDVDAWVTCILKVIEDNVGKPRVPRPTGKEKKDKSPKVDTKSPELKISEVKISEPKSFESKSPELKSPGSPRREKEISFNLNSCMALTIQDKEKINTILDMLHNEEDLATLAGDLRRSVVSLTEKTHYSGIREGDFKHAFLNRDDIITSIELGLRVHVHAVRSLAIDLTCEVSAPSIKRENETAQQLTLQDVFDRTVLRAYQEILTNYTSFPSISIGEFNKFWKKRKMVDYSLDSDSLAIFKREIRFLVKRILKRPTSVDCNQRLQSVHQFLFGIAVSVSLRAINCAAQQLRGIDLLRQTKYPHRYCDHLDVQRAAVDQERVKRDFGLMDSPPCQKTFVLPSIEWSDIIARNAVQFSSLEIRVFVRWKCLTVSTQGEGESVNVTRDVNVSYREILLMFFVRDILTDGTGGLKMRKTLFRKSSIIDKDKSITRSILLGQPFSESKERTNQLQHSGTSDDGSPDSSPQLEPKASKARMKDGAPQAVVVKNPLQEIIAARTFMVQIGEKNYRLESEIKSLKKLRSIITTSYNVDYEFDLEYYDQEFEQYAAISTWSDLPSGANQKLIKLRVVANQALVNKSINAEQIQDETGNELVMCSENKADKTMRVGIHPINYTKMRRQASDEYVPVISFLGPTGGGKSSLICKFNPSKKPVVALESQPIPTTSNINSFLTGGFDEIPHLRIMDVEGEDGGLPLMEYCKSEGISLDSIPGNDVFSLSSDDVVEFVETVFQRCDIKDLNQYMEARKKVTKNDFTRLSYIMSDVIIYVNTVPPKRESEYLERVLEFTSAAQRGISSAERPALIMVFNQCTKRETPFDIEDSTRQFFLLVDREKKLLESFRTVDFVKLPDWDHTELYKKQFSAFENRLRRRIKETKASKLAQGTLFAESAWFSILEKVVANFESQQLSMSRIFNKFILSESSLVNRAYSFFEAIYGSGSSDKLRFLKCREISIKTLGVYIIMHSKEKGHQSILENQETTIHLLRELLARIHRRTPCEVVLRGHTCTQESGTHDVHRFNITQGSIHSGYVPSRSISSPITRTASQASSANQGSQMNMKRDLSMSPSRSGIFKSFAASVTSSYSDDNFARNRRKQSTAQTEVEELLGAHRFDDPYPEDQLRETMLATISRLKKMSGVEFYKERLFIFRQGILNGCVQDSNLPKHKCFLCLKNKQDCLLTCSHTFCRYCILEFYTIDQIQRGNDANSDDEDIFSIACPLCLEEADLIPNIPGIPGRGAVRVLSLDGGGFRAALQVQMLERLTQLTGFEVSQMFDLICGVGASGPLALSFLVQQQAARFPINVHSAPNSPMRPKSIIGDERASTLSLHPGMGGGGHLSTFGTGGPNFSSIDDHREVFRTLPSLLKKKPLLQKLIGSRIFGAIFGSKYNAEDYEKILRDNVFGDNPDLLTSAAHNTTPKVFVVAGDANSLQCPVLLSNYPNARRTYLRVENKYKLWEAARATTATPGIFPFFQRDEHCFVDGSVFTSSPTELSITEAYNIWGYERDIDMVISMGTGIRSTKQMQGDGFISFLNEVIDLALASEETHTIIKSMSSRYHDSNRGEISTDSPLDDRPLFSYFRLNPELKKRENLANSAQKKNLNALMNRTEEWIKRNDDQFRKMAEIVRARVYVFDGEGARQATRGNFAEFSVFSRLNLNHQPSKGQKLGLIVEIEDETDVLVEGSPENSWRIRYVPTRLGLHHCSVMVTTNEEGAVARHISGSPFIINVVERENSEECDMDIPPELYIPFHEFIQYTTFADGNPIPVEESRSEQQRKILIDRMEPLGVIGDSYDVIRRNSPFPADPSYISHDTDNLMKSLSSQLFYDQVRYNFVRKSIAGWLTNHPHHKLGDGSMLCEYVSSWDDYCDSVETEGKWPDAFSLVAACEFFGVRIVIASAKEGARYITSIKPRVYKRKRPLLIGHWSDFCYGSLIPWTEPSLLRTSTIPSTPIRRSKANSLAFSPRNARFNIKEAENSPNISPVKGNVSTTSSLSTRFDHLDIDQLLETENLHTLSQLDTMTESIGLTPFRCVEYGPAPLIRALPTQRRVVGKWRQLLDPTYIEITHENEDDDHTEEVETESEEEMTEDNRSEVSAQLSPTAIRSIQQSMPPALVQEPKSTKRVTSIIPVMQTPQSQPTSTPVVIPTNNSSNSSSASTSLASSPSKKDTSKKESKKEVKGEKKKKGWFF
ncbi:hypothetical protein PROFUN_08240 [Planoprotostelium fungivorum]|uniref:Uncharacterized protein n=1 Tax=Planoprotostelium fungivorum TaxID=1890364 RepID=A0A2P6NK76_9EUKA|nr:hypothetical protein PROFUN_08240 [Planoprotostelium fungivorum]